jgi:hypothetical protein
LPGAAAQLLQDRAELISRACAALAAVPVAARRILALEDDLAAERALIARLRGRLDEPGAQDG